MVVSEGQKFVILRGPLTFYSDEKVSTIFDIIKKCNTIWCTNDTLYIRVLYLT